MPKTVFQPNVNGFHFGNHFVNNILQLPIYGNVTTLGRCGGMSFAALDFFNAHLPVPAGTDQTFASTGSVPPDGSPLADYIYHRQLDSFLVPSAVKFVTWSVTPDGPSFLLRGVETWSKQDEFQKVRTAVDAGKPSPLGLIVATDLTGLAHNHQVVAYGYELDLVGNPASVYIYDNNHPDQEVTLTLDSNGSGWQESTGEHWRGFFMQDYTPAAPPAVLEAAAAPVSKDLTERLIASPDTGAQTKPVVAEQPQSFVVTFDTIRFDGDEQLLGKGRVALNLMVNGKSARWPRSGARVVIAGENCEVGKSLMAVVSGDDSLSVQVNAVETLLGDVQIADNDTPVAALRHEFTRAEGWGKGRHKDVVSGLGGYTIKYTIKPRK